MSRELGPPARIWQSLLGFSVPKSAKSPKNMVKFPHKIVSGKGRGWKLMANSLIVNGNSNNSLIVNGSFSNFLFGSFKLNGFSASFQSR